MILGGWAENVVISTLLVSWECDHLDFIAEQTDSPEDTDAGLYSIVLELAGASKLLPVCSGL